MMMKSMAMPLACIFLAIFKNRAHLKICHYPPNDAYLLLGGVSFYIKSIVIKELC